MPYFKTFCGCCSLRSGTSIIGFFSAILSTLGLVSSLTAGQDGYISSSKYSLAIVVLLILVFTSILLLVGAVKRSSELLWGWMVASPVGLIAWTINEFSNTIPSSGIIRHHPETLYYVLTILTIFAIFALYIYSIMVVHSYYKQLQRIEREEADPSDTCS